MRQLLPYFPKPSHYAGIEDGIVIKPSEEISLHIALAFPDTYEIGMSYLGQKILYNIINQRKGWQAERVFAPEREAASLLKKHNIPLCTLETSTPLNKLDAIGFSITHELCYTDVLHMLDLAHIPARHENRPNDLKKCPLVIGGGGAMLGAEAIVPFFDLVCLGDGEELLPEVLQLLEKSLAENPDRNDFLRKAAKIDGVYVPSLFELQPDGTLKPLVEGYQPARRIVSDLNDAVYPVSQVAPVGAIHNRLSLEISRGCTRGCRFCHAGIVYRPARERSPENLEKLLNDSLDQTGFEEISFLSLSAGDYSALSSLWNKVWDRCAQEQISISLPSLRVGSVNDEIMTKMALLRRTGCTLAPEAGSQRLRDVINKGITGEQLLAHARKLLEHGWRQVKLYFMIGLPTETYEDLDAILELCRKTRDAGGQGAPKLAVTASISPFVPKPFTPFQWEAQIDRNEMERRINYCKELFTRQKQLSLRWHNPDSSHLEGILSRADRRMADVLEKAYEKGAIFCSWAESFSMAPWYEAFSESGIDIAEMIGAKDPEKPLPWDHLECGVSKQFLQGERKRAFSGIITEDCRYGRCGQCGACDTKLPSRLPHSKSSERHGHKLVFRNRDQEDIAEDKTERPIAHQARPITKGNQQPNLAHYRIWHAKSGNFAYLSQLELQAVIYRAMRRAKLPVAFSQGFHPLPLLSFGRALPVGVESKTEWFGITLNEFMTPGKVSAKLNEFLAKELETWQIEIVEKKHKTDQAIAEIFQAEFENPASLEIAAEAMTSFFTLENFKVKKESKKGEKIINIRPLLHSWQFFSMSDGKNGIQFLTDWSAGYISPFILADSIFNEQKQLPGNNFKLCKTGQIFENGKKYKMPD